MKKMLFVLNPCAGKRKANKLLTDIVTPFNRAGYDVSVYITAAPGEAHTMVAQRAKDLDLVVCCGGDGTFNETVAGIMESGADTAIGYIPAGSTNDFASSLGLHTKPKKAAQAIAEGSPAAYDAGLFGDRAFTYVASFGAFTRASYATSQSVKNALGHMAYVLSGVKELSQIKKIRTHIRLDGEDLDGDYIFGAVCNSTSIGGIAKLDPDTVDMSDGLFEVLLVRAPKGLGELAECVSAVRKHKYDNCRMMTFRTASTLEVSTEGNVPWTLDGEKAETDGVVQIKNIHHAFRLVK